MIEQKTDPVDVKLVELRPYIQESDGQARVELKTQMRCPKQLFAFWRLWDFESFQDKLTTPPYLRHVATYRLSEDHQREMDVMAWILSECRYTTIAFMPRGPLVVLGDAGSFNTTVRLP